MKWKESLIISKRWVFFIISAIIIAGYAADLYNAGETINPFPNLVCIIITLAAAVGLLTKLINTQISSLIVVYSLALNLVLSFYLNLGQIEYFEADVLRSMLIFGLLMTIAGFVNGKIHLLIMGCFCIIWLIVVMVMSKNIFLTDNAFIIFIVALGYTIGLYILFKMLENSAFIKNKLIDQLRAKSRELENSNQLLTQEKSVSEAQKAELKSLMESREKLFAIISHDIKNPLSAIISFSDLLITKIEQNNFSRATEFSKIIHQSSTNLYRLLINLLDWTKMQSGTLAVVPEWISPEVHIRESIEVFSTALGEKKINLEMNLSESDKIFADRNMLTAIIRNLYSNALKYTHKGGKIRIESKIENGKYLFTIADTGIGIQASRIDQILNSQEEYSTMGTNGEMGTGLGLLLCREFVQLHHGNLSIESGPGEGSLISFVIPAEYKDEITG